MNKSAAILMQSSNSNPHFRNYLYWVAVGLMIIGLLMPWVVTTSAGTTMNAYDLAEWTSLHPITHAEFPNLLTPMLLRFGYVVLALTVAANVTSRYLSVAIFALIAVALLPPIQFLSNMNNSNYRQLLGLALFTLIAGSATTFLRGKVRVLQWLGIAAPLAGIIAIYFALRSAVTLIQEFHLGVGIGAGVVFYLVGAGGAVLTAYREEKGYYWRN